jgi:Na+/proline symporter
MTNILVTAMLLTGGSAVVTSLSGVPTAAACFLLPIGVVLYTMFGGIKATFLTDYVHTVMILIIICGCLLDIVSIDHFADCDHYSHLCFHSICH